MTVEITDKIYLRGHLLTKGECDWYGHNLLNGLGTFAMATVVLSVVPLGLYGTWKLISNGEWWFPWDVLKEFPWAWFPCLLFGLFSAYQTHFKTWLSGYPKWRKLESRRYTQADIDKWTMEVKGKTYRTADGQMPKIFYDMTLDDFMADRTLD